MPQCDNCDGYVSHDFQRVYEVETEEGGEYLLGCPGCVDNNAGIAEAINQRLEQNQI